MIRNILQTIAIIGSGLAIAAVMLFVPNHDFSRALAQSASSETPYGGMRVYTLTCDCSGNSLLYIMDYRTNTILTLLYQAGASILYSYYNVYTSTYLLGTYTSTGNSCKIYVGEDCVDISSEGQLGSQPGTGTSQY